MSEENAKSAGTVAIETAVKKVSKSLQELNKVFEKHGGSADDLKKAYFVLERGLAASKRRAELDREIANSAADEFSLDTVNIDDITPVVAPMIAPQEKALALIAEGVKAQPADPRLLDPAFARKVRRHERAKSLGGRLVKSAPGPIQPNTPLPTLDEEDDDLDDFGPDSTPDDGVDFIDD